MIQSTILQFCCAQVAPKGFSKGSVWQRLLTVGLCAAVALGSPLFAQKPGGRGAMSAQQIQAQKSQRRDIDPPPVNGGPVMCPENDPGDPVTYPTNLFSQKKTFSSTNGTLEVTLNLETDIDSGSGAQRYCYVTPTGDISPTLRVNPGDTLIIHFYNQLPKGLVPAIPQAQPGMPGMPGMSHSMAAGLQTSLFPNDHGNATTSPVCTTGAMTASVSNLHFHGLNVSPTCGSDEVVNTLVQPGAEFDYTIQIPANEPPGLYWYHPHPHGFSEGQLLGGATGAIIVEGLQLANPSLVGLPEQTLILRDQLTPVSQQSMDGVPAWDISLNFVPILFPDYTPATLSVYPNQKQVWRIANTAADTIFNLQYLVAGVAQSMTVVAIDGVSLTGGPIQQTSILLGPGGRAEIVVTTPPVGIASQLVTNNIDTGPYGDNDPNRPIANIVADPTTPLLPTLQAIQPVVGGNSQTPTKRFADLPHAASVAQRTLYFSEVLSDPTNPASPTNFFITQNGETPQLFTMGQAPNIVVHSGTVETWVIQNRAMEDHVFHIHQIHFQVLAVNGVAVTDPAIRDTYVVPYWTGSGPYPSITVAMDFRDPNIIGTFVYHCHILGHEDAGMMGAIQVLSPGSASTVTVSSAASTVTPISTVTLTATVASSVAGGSTPTGQVQFQANGSDVGNPVPVTGGVAKLTVSGSQLQNGTNSVQVFYMGDSFYSESVSAATTVSNAPFGITGTAATVLGGGANASLQVVIATNYTNAVKLTCALPSGITGSTCAVYPPTVTGGGPATLAITTTVAANSSPNAKPRFAVVPASLIAVSALLLPLLRRRRRLRTLVSLAALFVLSGLLALSGCSGSTFSGSSTGKTGTAPGTYNVVVTGTGSNGTATYTASTTVPITVQ